MPPVVAAIAVYATSGAVAGIIGSTVGQVVAGAVIGAVAGGATAAIMGDDIGEGALQGAISGLVVSGTSALIGAASGGGAGAAESSAAGLAEHSAAVAAKAPTALWESTAGMTGDEIAGSVASTAGKGILEQGVSAVGGATKSAAEPVSDVGKIIAAQQQAAADTAKWTMFGQAASGAVSGLLGTDQEDLLEKKYQYEQEAAERERSAISPTAEQMASLTPSYNKMIAPFSERIKRIEERYNKK